MKASEIRRRLKPWMLPIAMVTGIVFHSWIHYVAFLTPYLIFTMLLITFCRVNPKEIRVDRMSARLIMVQLLGSVALYLMLRPVNEVLAQGAFMCVFCPTATAAPVVTGMLGGSVGRLVSYSLVSNVSVAVIAPLAFTVMGSQNVDILSATATIASRVAPLILLPLVVAVVMGRTVPRVHHALATHQSLSFYIWAVSLIIVVGNSVSFVMNEPPEEMMLIVWLALAAGVACGVQFAVGRRIGRSCGDKISGAQGLGQKNTVLAIWMAMTYLNPLSSVAPAAYVAWQNTVNSIQIYFRQRSEARRSGEQTTAEKR